MSTRRVVKKEEPAIEKPITTKYRPQAFKDVLGQDKVVKSLEDVLSAKSRQHAFAFTGPAGTGKTTLARIVARELDVVDNNVLEIDAATSGGIDEMRRIMEPLKYKGFGDSPNKAIIIDEAHRLSKQAWDSLLKTVEEAPDHVFFFFCSTESGKIPATIQSRCVSYTLRPLAYEDLMDILDDVCDREGYDTPKRVLELIAKSCGGGARLALSMLAQCHGAEDEEEAARMIESPLESKEVIDLCRDLVQGKLTWERLTATLKAMPEMPAESVRIMIVNYLASCLMGSRGDKATMRLLDMLECFADEYRASDKNAPLFRSFGRLLYP